jgi:tetratricopeptide (TPR) repeat protein
MGRNPWDDIFEQRARMIEQLYPPQVMREIQKTVRAFESTGLAGTLWDKRTNDMLALAWKDYVSEINASFARLREAQSAFGLLALETGSPTRALLEQFRAEARELSERLDNLKKQGAAAESDVRGLQQIAAEAARLAEYAPPPTQPEVASVPVWIPPIAGSGRQAKLEQEVEECRDAIHDLRTRLEISEAMRYEASGDYEHAEFHAQLVVKQQPNSIWPLFLLGRILNRQGKHAEACAAFDEAQRIDPDCFADQQDGWAIYQSSLKGQRWEGGKNDVES